MVTSTTEPGCPAEMGSVCVRRHWSVYWLLIALSFAVTAGGIARLQNRATRGESPFFSANDRSRWCTIYSLVHFGTYEIDRVVARPASIHWDTIDKVVHVGADGQWHQYSSKPPLLPTLLAGQYWVIRALTGWNLDEHPILVARLMLLINHAIPLALMLVMLAAMLERWFVADWTRYFVVAAAGFGTFLTTFAVSLNNHIPAAIATMAALYFMERIWRDKEQANWGNGLAMGVAAAFAATCELPAAALVGMLGLLVLGRGLLRATLGYALGCGAVAIPFFLCNYLAHGGMFELPYRHRSDGPVIREVQGDFAAMLDQGTLPDELRRVADDWVAQRGGAPLRVPQVVRGTWMGQDPELLGRWIVRDGMSTTQFAIVQSAPDRFAVREWFNWYDFPGSYWSSDKRSSIDMGEPDLAKYAFHMTLGHHGIFSLTPLWVFSMAGMLVLLVDRRYERRWLGILTIILTAIVFAFYLRQEPHDRNYGGQTSGLRWMFWLIPLWLLSMTPVVQWLARTGLGRCFALVILAASVLSAGYSQANPWVHPWLMVLWEWLHWP